MFTRLALRPGLDQDHSCSRKASERRSARVYSKTLVEANSKPAEKQLESRGVAQIYPVGGEPGARAERSRAVTRKEAASAGRQGSKASYWLRRMGATSLRDS